MLTSIYLLLSTVVPPVPTAAPQPVEVGFQLAAGEFTAHNYSSRAQALVFHHGGNHAQYALLPGEDVRWSIPSNLTTSVELEVLSRGVENTWLVSDALALDGLVASNVASVWVQSTSPRSLYWVETAAGFVTCITKPSLCAEDLSAPISAAADETPTFESMQVPVTPPITTPTGDLPPKIEPVPLPPI
jgi:hypothetical protein